MSDSITIGPLVIPSSLLLMIIVGATTAKVAKWAGWKQGIDVRPLLWRAFLIGIMAARLAYVYEFRRAYFDAPISILDIRDGGWSPVAGFIGAWLYALRHTVRHPLARKPLHRALWTASVLWIIGSIVLAASPGGSGKLPSVALASLDGATVDLTSFEGKPTVVNLWATWCPPCVREMPVLQNAQATRPSINFVFVNQGESPEQVRSWLLERRLELRNVVLDAPRKVGAALGHSAYPTTLFFDAKGALVATRIGELSAATLSEKLDLFDQ